MQGYQLKQRRIRLGLTRADVADELGCTAEDLRAIEDDAMYTRIAEPPGFTALEQRLWPLTGPMHSDEALETDVPCTYTLGNFGGYHR